MPKLNVQCAFCDRLLSGKEEPPYFLATCGECMRSMIALCLIGPVPPRDDGEDDVWRDIGGDG